MNNSVSAWLNEADDVNLDDFDPEEDDSEGKVLIDNPEIIAESV